MNLVKWGIASVVVACTAAVACGGSSSSSGNGSGAGTSNSSAGSSNHGGSSSTTGGSSSTTGGSSASSGGSSSHAGSTSTGGTGGVSCNPMMQGMGGMGATCPAFTNCIESKCKTQLDTCQSASGVCADYANCVNPCNCDQACIDKCPAPSTACMGCLTTAENCILSQCLNDALSCGAGSGGDGAGGTFNLGDAGTHTCADLTTCCATISDAQQKTQCQMVADQKIDLFCGLAYDSLCP